MLQSPRRVQDLGLIQMLVDLSGDVFSSSHLSWFWWCIQMCEGLGLEQNPVQLGGPRSRMIHTSVFTPLPGGGGGTRL